jgi:hypothetical protein
MSAHIARNTCTGNPPNFSGDFLNGDHQRKAEQKRPAQTITKLRANLAVRTDPRWIVIRSASYQAGTEA